MKDQNIRNALHQEEQNRPPMPADLNARLMQRVEKEVNSKAERKHTRIVWPWIAAACVAGVIMMFLMPPKIDNTVSDETSIAKVEKDSVKQQIEILQIEEPQTLIANVAKERMNELKIAKAKTAKESDTSNLIAMTEKDIETTAEEVIATDSNTHRAKETTYDNCPSAEPQPRMLTERDIPITRPENYKYTKEEIALMKKQANEAYLKWVELEIEISKYNLENTAENR
ncbi:MAG: hypothetical protein KBT33_13900 [Prevotellaceae bacterium]|nr:hypothetical protein [Candidatus Minthosoma equi]